MVRQHGVSFDERLQIKSFYQQVVSEKAVVLESIRLNKATIATRDTLLPKTFVHCTISLEHSALTMSHVVEELSSVLDTCAPILLARATEPAMFQSTCPLGLLALAIHLDYPPANLSFYNDRYGPLSFSMLLSFDKVSFKHTSIETYELPVPLRLSILEAANVAASIDIGLYACSMFESIAERTLVNVTNVGLKDAIAERLVVGPHARVVELRVYFSPSSVPMLHPLVELTHIGLLCGLFDQLSLAMALIVDEMTNVDVFVLVNFVTLTLAIVVLPLAFIQANDKTRIYWLLIINQ